MPFRHRFPPGMDAFFAMGLSSSFQENLRLSRRFQCDLRHAKALGFETKGFLSVSFRSLEFHT
jgi:hypothetical protein